MSTSTLIAAAVAVGGVLGFALSTNSKLAEIGRISFFIGGLVLLFLVCGIR